MTGIEYIKQAVSELHVLAQETFVDTAMHTKYLVMTPTKSFVFIILLATKKAAYYHAAEINQQNFILMNFPNCFTAKQVCMDLSGKNL